MGSDEELHTVVSRLLHISCVWATSKYASQHFVSHCSELQLQCTGIELHEKQVHPLTLVFLLRSAPQRSSFSTMSKRPDLEAICSGVSMSTSFMTDHRSAPSSTSRPIASTFAGPCTITDLADAPNSVAKVALSFDLFVCQYAYVLSASLSVTRLSFKLVTCPIGTQGKLSMIGSMHQRALSALGA